MEISSMKKYVFILLSANFFWNICGDFAASENQPNTLPSSVLSATSKTKQLDRPVTEPSGKGAKQNEATDTDITGNTAEERKTTDFTGNTAKESKPTDVSEVTTTVERAATEGDKSWCSSQNISGCPDNFYPVDDTLCLTVIADSESGTQGKQCSRYGAYLPDESHIFAMQSCVTHILQNSTIRMIQLSNGKYLNVQTGILLETSNQFHVACLLEKNKLVPSAVISFYVDHWNNSDIEPNGKLRHDLLNSSTHQVSIETTSNELNIACTASGYPKPDVAIERDNTPLATINGTSLITTDDCQGSGVYTCHARNIFTSDRAERHIQISSPIGIVFAISPKEISDGKVDRNVSNLDCSVMGCPEPLVMTIRDEVNQTVLNVSSESSITSVRSSVQCSDVGTYVCTAEFEDGRVLEEKAEMTSYECPVKLCRNEKESKTITVARNKTIHVSLCVMSHKKPSWTTQNGTDGIYVSFRRIDSSVIYWMATITVSNIEEYDKGTKTVTISNSKGSLDYQIHLIIEKQTSQASPQEPSPEEDSYAHFIWPPLMFLTIFVIAFIAVILRRKRTKALVSSRASKTSGCISDDSGHVLYSNVGQLETSPLRDSQEQTELGTRLEKYEHSVFPSDLIDQNSGRFMSDDGLVYAIVDTDNKKPKQAKMKPCRAKHDPEDDVEYVTVDFEKTGQSMITEEEVGKSEEPEEGDRITQNVDTFDD